MTKGILEGRAKLYQHALEVLSYLKKSSYRLIFLSNCSIEYMNTHDKIFGLSQLFDEMICSEQYAFEKSKKEIVQERFGGKNIRLAMIGDRKQDMDVGSLAYVSTVGCAYGYGSPEERRQANMIIEDIKALLLYF
ncbi:HAD family hydrolase [Marinilactibacillus kalidii]|uniref:HAD family hydrolase n=1 Tax=Marinilactibacillus kalidii TaxID=2820274 RepID=UPI001ABE64CD|nr:HAD hydrolase-like protein [Marinilactibacillus kalidii]